MVISQSGVANRGSPGYPVSILDILIFTHNYHPLLFLLVDSTTSSRVTMVYLEITVCPVKLGHGVTAVLLDSEDYL